MTSARAEARRDALHELPRAATVDTTPETERPDAAVERLVRDAAAALGIELGSLTVRTDEEATARVRARGASGLADGQTILLDGERFAARAGPALDRRAREIVAHEVVHVAQRGESGRPAARRRPDAPAAEREARRLAARFADGRRVSRPLATLPTGHQAADVAWAGLRALRESLDELDNEVATSRPHEWQTLQNAVSADGSVSSEQVDLVVRTLASVPAPVVRALVHRLPAASRWDIVRQFNADHFEMHRPVVIGALAALDHEHLSLIEKDFLEDISLLGLSTLEHDLLLLALAAVPPAVMTEILEEESKDLEAPQSWHELLQGEGIQTMPVNIRKGVLAPEGAVRATAQERARRAEETGRLVRRLGALIRHNEEGAVQAVNDISEIKNEDLRAAVVQALEGQGHITHLIDEVDGRDGDGETLSTPAFGKVLAGRTPGANLATVSDRLSGGIFGWDWTEDIAITQADALIAFWALAGLPADVRERLLRANDTGLVDRVDQGDVLDKMERNLPEWFVIGEHYRSLAVVRDRAGQPVERTQAVWDAGATAFLAALRELLDEGRRTEALVALDEGRLPEGTPRAKAPGATPPVSRNVQMTDQLRATIVDRLDALDVMDGFLEDLPYETRQGREERLRLLRVCAARSVPNLLRHTSSLLHTGIEDWAVMSWEADLAYVLYRSLPPYEQTRYPRLADITGEMSADVRTWSGTNLLDATTATARAAAVRKQLEPDEMWVASRAGQLRVLVGMAFALGEGRYAYQRSYDVGAYEDPSLREIVRDFQLYQDGGDLPKDYKERPLENRPWYNEGPFSYATLIGGFIWVAIRDAFAGQFSFDLFNGVIGHEDFDLNEMADLLGGHTGGARFAQRRDTERGRERNPDVSERANRAGLRYDQRNNLLNISIPELALESLGILRTGWAANSGAIRIQGLTIDATFETSNLRHPRSIVLDMPTTTVSDLLVTTPQSVYAAGHIGIDGLRVTGAASTVDEHSTTGRGFWTYIPVLGPMIEWVYLLFQAIGLGMNSSTQTAAGMTELRSAHVQIADVSVRGLMLNGTPIEQVNFGPITLGWGGTRAAYLQEQERALVERLKTAPEGARRDHLTEQLAKVREELPTALDDDRRLDELTRRSQRDPGSLTSSDHDEILRLQRAPGGLVIDAGTIELHGIGDIAELATIQRISGEVAANAVTGGRLTDAALADRFRSSGPPVGVGDRVAAAGGLDLGTVDVTLRPPDIATLQRWRREAEAAGGTARVARIDLAIEQREELDNLRSAQDARIRGGQDPSATDAARIQELLGLLATSIHAEGVTAQVDTTTGVLTLGAERITGGPIDTSQFGARRIDVEGVSIPISTDPSQIPALMLIPEQTERMSDEARAQLYGDRARETITGAGLGVRRATLTDVRVGAGDSNIGEVVISGVRGGVITPVEEGVRIQGFHVDSITGKRAQIRLGAHSIDAPGGVGLEDIDASFTVLLGADHSFRGARIDRADIATVRVRQPEPPAEAATVPPGTPSPAPISYTNLASGFSVELFDGSLTKVWFENVLLSSTESGIDIRSSAEGERTGDQPLGGIERIDGLRLAASVGGWRVSTTLGSPNAGEGPAGALTVGEARQGGWFLDLKGLQMTDAEVRSPDGSVRIRRLDWTHSHMRYDGEGLYLDALDIPLVEVGALRWRIGAAGVLSSVGGATIHNISARARARLVEREGEKHIAEFVLPELRVGSITAEDFRYRDGPIDIQFRRLGPTDPAPVSINDIVVTDVRWVPGEVPRFDVRTGTVGLAVDAGAGRVGTALADREWGFIGQVSAGGLHFRQDETGITAGATELGLAGDAQVAGVGGTHLDVQGVNLPALTFGGNTISVPASAAGALRIRSIELTAMRFEAGGGVTVSTTPRNNVRLEELETGFDIELIDVIHAGREPTRMIDSITLHRVDATRLSTTGLHIHIPDVLDATVSTGLLRSDISGIHVKNLRFNAVAQPNGRWKLEMSGYDEVRIDHIELHDLAFRAPLGVTVGEDVPEPTRRAQAQSEYQQYRADKASGVATTEDWIGAFSKLIDTADGSIHVDLDLPIYLMGENLGGRIDANIDIVDGAVDYVRLEEQILEELNIADSVIDFEVDEDTKTFFIQLDLKKVGVVIGGLAGLGGGAYFSKALVSWDIEAEETTRAADTDMIRVARLLVPRREAPSEDPSPVEIDFGQMVLNTLDVNLSLNNEDTITVTMPSGYGSLDFAPNALQGLRIGVGAGIPGRPIPNPRYCVEIPPARAALDFSLDRLALAGASLNLPIGNLTTGAMSVSDLRNGRINLERAAAPQTPATPDRPHDTGLSLRLVDISGNAGTIEVRDLVLTPAGPSGP